MLEVSHMHEQCQEGIIPVNITFRHDGVSLPVRALVPIFYNVRRLFTLVDWVKVDMSKGQESVGMHGAQTGPFSPEQWIMFGRILAASNLLMWTLNLFFFLIPVYLPRAFRKHYEMEFSATESRAKDAPDASQS